MQKACWAGDMTKGSNRLAGETSTYLLQHVDNPVDWHPWSDEAFELARSTDRLVLVSIGYSSCHWCHVMAHESFEDPEVAALMNEHMVCIKVDREERPDVDEYYMSAVQMMTGQGGWPLNCITIPDGRPIFGGTYFPKAQWTTLVQKLATIYRDDREKVLEYAQRMEEGLRPGAIVSQDDRSIGLEELESIPKALTSKMDKVHGGLLPAPKFPMPGMYQWMLEHAVRFSDRELAGFVHHTLTHMTSGGMYDAVGGGFSRYSVDGRWRVPHFEKMLYDNAQLLSTVAMAASQFADKRMEWVAKGMVQWLQREMRNEEGGYISALDADTEGEEGKFYVWSEDELTQLLSNEELELAKGNLGVRKENLWEGNYVIGLDPGSDPDEVEGALEKLFLARSERIAPGKDSKVLLGWNAMLVSGLCDVHRYLGLEQALDLAMELDSYLFRHQEEGEWYRVRSQSRNHVPALLEDHAFLLRAWLDLFQVTGQDRYYRLASSHAKWVHESFYDESLEAYRLAPRHVERSVGSRSNHVDDVEPCGESVMAEVWSRLASLGADVELKERCDRMISKLIPGITRQPTAFYNWARVLTQERLGRIQLVISGEEDWKKNSRREIQEKVLPGVDFMDASENGPASGQDKVSEENKIYICEFGSCQRPNHSVGEAMVRLVELGVRGA